MKNLCFHVDFNEMTDANTVLLSVDDHKIDAHGRTVPLRDGMPVRVYMDDVNAIGEVDNLVANGVVVRNTDAGWAAQVKWCCRIDEDGVRPQSEVTNQSGRE